MPSPEPNNGAGYRGFQDLNTGASQVNTISFIVQSILSRVATATLVQVKSVTNSGGVTAVGYVDILPLVKQIDGNWNSVPHATVYRCPYSRMQGGTNAIILDPEVGDIGIAIFADHDISSVVANRDSADPQANPGSRRQFDMADALYLGGVLNKVPIQYVQFSTVGVKIHSPTKVTLEAPDVVIDAETFEVNASDSVTVETPELNVNAEAFNVTGTLMSIAANVAITGSFTVNGVDVGNAHRHSGVTTGGGNTGTPL